MLKEAGAGMTAWRGTQIKGKLCCVPRRLSFRGLLAAVHGFFTLSA